MSDEIINPFKETKVDWAKKSRERIFDKNKEELPRNTKNSERKEYRVAKSFKIFKGRLSRDFDKRVKRMQVKYDDLDYEKDYTDAGKYIMFLMAFAEKYKLYELYKPVDGDGEIEMDRQEVINHFARVFSEK